MKTSLRPFDLLTSLMIIILAGSMASWSRAADFHEWAETPPMGWNSWDCFATTITEAQAKAQADFMAEHLAPYGWQYLVVDIQWYEPEAKSFEYRKGARLTMDEFGRLWPATNRFPSSADGVGFAALSDYVHRKGLKFGVHLLRGIPRQAVALNTAVKGTRYYAADIADTNSICEWNTDMYGVAVNRPGAQEYYNSVFDLFAAWGVDFVKVDDIARPYHTGEIEAIRRAIDQTGRPMVLSLSPGATPLAQAEHVSAHANMWRISDDFWDQWKLLFAQFARLRDWAPYSGPGHFPDADMLPLGVTGMGRHTHFTPDEQFTLMSLWAIARSPLIFGGDMTRMDAFTLSLLTNAEIIAVDQHSTGNHELFDRDGLIVWTATPQGSADKYAALFNTRGRAAVGSDVPILIKFSEVGLGTECRVRDLWAQKDLGTFTNQFAPLIKSHGAGLFRITDLAGSLNWTASQDHQNMMEQLGIIRLRPGPNGRPGLTNSANYDPAKADPFPDLPDILTLKNGQKVATPEMWWKQRRPEIVEDFEREVLGRVPGNVPEVTWTWNMASNVVDGLVGNLPANGKRLIGHVDNSACPSITVDIRMTVVTPAHATGPVPLLMMFGGFGGDGLPRPAGTPPPTNRSREFGGPFNDPPSTEQLLANGWGYAIISPASIQADNGAGLTKGIIGLVNKGRPRKPDDWGALRAWAWGASRGLDYLETDPAVDAQKVGIEGVSRFGKAALVTMAFDPRFAMVLVGSSGEGGAKLYRRNFGEAVESLTGTGEYHWMAGNFLKYGAAEASFGSRNAGDLPVDAHMLVALCAPRLTFISYGVPERGDALWLDQQGSYMATVAAGPVFRLLGAKDLGVTADYRTVQMPPVNTGLLEGQLAWRQHDGGHEDRSNMKYFIAWADKFIQWVPPARAVPPAR